MSSKNIKIIEYIYLSISVILIGLIYLYPAIYVPFELDDLLGIRYKVPILPVIPPIPFLLYILFKSIAGSYSRRYLFFTYIFIFLGLACIYPSKSYNMQLNLFNKVMSEKQQLTLKLPKEVPSTLPPEIGVGTKAYTATYDLANCTVTFEESRGVNIE